MEFILIALGCALGLGGTLAWQTVWPIFKAKQARKARTAKAVATRRANAIRKAAIDITNTTGANHD